MNLIELIKSRRTIRKFKQKDVPVDLLRELVDCARLAPSAANSQALEYIIIKNSDIIKQVYKNTNWAGARDIPPVYIAVLINAQRVSKWGVIRDVGAAVENILLAGYANNLGACWIAAADMDKIKKVLNLDEKYTVDSLIAIGYPDEKSVTEDLDTETKYWKDDKNITHVPKRPLEKILIIKDGKA